MKRAGCISTTGTTGRSKQSARLQQVVVVSVICLAVYCFLVNPSSSLDSTLSMLDTFPRPLSSSSIGGGGTDAGRSRLTPELLDNRFLTEDQCKAAFPGLTKEIDDVVAKGPFVLERRKGHLGPLIARIRDGKVLDALPLHPPLHLLLHPSPLIHHERTTTSAQPAPTRRTLTTPALHPLARAQVRPQRRDASAPLGDAAPGSGGVANVASDLLGRLAAGHDTGAQHAG